MAQDDPFALLGLPRRFDLPAAQIATAHLRKASALHPDRIADPIAQAEAASAAARINDARSILMDDEQRANVLLALLGGATREQDKSLPEGFLMGILEVRQEMEQAMASDDPADRTQWEQWARERRAEYRRIVGGLFERVAASQSGLNPTLREIRLQLNAWRYIERMIEQLRESHEM